MKIDKEVEDLAIDIAKVLDGHRRSHCTTAICLFLAGFLNTSNEAYGDSDQMWKAFAGALLMGHPELGKDNRLESRSVGKVIDEMYDLPMKYTEKAIQNTDQDGNHYTIRD
jgi:hypothetical protein